MKNLLRSSVAKRVLSAGLVVVLVIAMIQVIPMNSAMDVTFASEDNGIVVRGAIKNISDLPQAKYGIDNYYNIPRGTSERPFVVLEIVPYEEYAEFGYLIGGCEPIDASLMHADQGFYGAVNTLNAYKQDLFTAYKVYYFVDEPEADGSLYFSSDNNGVRSENYKTIYPNDWSELNTFNGYFELVEDGKGTFSYKKELMNSGEATGDADGQAVSSAAAGVADDQIVSSVATGDIDNQMVSSVTTGDADGQVISVVGGASLPENYSSGAMLDIEYINSDNTATNDDTQPVSTDEEEIDNGETDNESDANQGGEIIDENTDVNTDENTDGNNVDNDHKDIEDVQQQDDANESVDNETVFDTDVDIENSFSEEEKNGWEIETTDSVIDDGFSQTISGNDAETEEVWKVTIKKQAGGNLIWHTVNAFDKDANADFVPYSDELVQNNVLQNIGDRLYTTRSRNGELSDEGGDTLLYIENYHVYNNADHFLKASMGLSDKQAENYSIVVKTITPQELNQYPDWVNYSDLIILSPKSHVGALPKIWTTTHGRTEPAHTEQGFDRDGFDLTWDVTMRIYNKVTAVQNYAGIIIDDGLYNSVSLTSLSAKMYDYNLRPNGWTQNISVSERNIYKLCVMLLSMDSNLFRQLYLSGSDPLIQNGVFKLRQDEGELAYKWGFGTFYLMEPNDTRGPWQYWDDADQWNDFGTWANVTSNPYKYWCNEHVFTYKGDRSIAQDYMNNHLGGGDYGKTFDDFYASLTDEEREAIHSSLAVRYILNSAGDSQNETYGSNMTLRILDLEPSVGLFSDGNPDWLYRESYFHMLLPHFGGKIEVTHQTTAEFIGKIEDLNTTYNMIYMGLDFSAYNTASIATGKNEWGGDIYETLPDWNDNSLDGKIYIHTGDKMTSAEFKAGSGSRSVKWLLQNNSVLNSDELRFPGNDISLVKKDDLTDFLKAGYPIVADAYLYNLDKTRIENPSNIYSFISEVREYANMLSTKSSLASIEKSVKNSLRTNVQFTELPKKYNGSTSTEDSPIVTNPNYLDTRYLNFKFNLTPSGNEKYYFRIYTDQNRNSKFSSDEVVYTNVANPGSNEYSYRISASWVGLVSWKIEVYEVYTNSAGELVETGLRYSETGRSAVRNTGDKKLINVLQIMPLAEDNPTKDIGYLDLSKNPRFTKYYKQLQDYEITVTSITWDEFASYFYRTIDETKVTRGFYYDYTKSINEVSNPVNLGELGGNLDDYNMIIMGFGDTYGGINLSNEFGAVDYLRYYVDQGKSILFTHDLTSMYNVEKTSFGYTVNALMRDLMGMNRYKAVSSKANDAGNPTNPAKESDMLKTYQSSHNYDWLNNDAKHGYTYVTLKRLGYSASTTDVSGGGKVPYKYMIVNPKGNYVNDNIKFGKDTGFNNGSDITTKVSMTNDGQVTTYPYLIGDELTVSPTHGQWYSLNPEDEDVTVWYSLAGDPQNMFDVGLGGGNGTSLSYAVSPNDAMNNYYIYSKGNIFYSGVGHSTVNGDMEAKLFINTMIAAYNASHEPPAIEVTNPEATLTGTKTYSIELLQNYDYGVDAEGNFIQIIETFDDSSVYPVNFVPLDSNLISTQFVCTIFYDNGNGNIIYVDEVVELKNENGDPVLNADGTPKKLKANPTTHTFTNLENGKNYRLSYPKKYLENPVHDVYFTIKDNRDTGSTTVLHMDTLPLFPLD